MSDDWGEYIFITDIGEGFVSLACLGIYSQLEYVFCTFTEAKDYEPAAAIPVVVIKSDKWEGEDEEEPVKVRLLSIMKEFYEIDCVLASDFSRSKKWKDVHCVILYQQDSWEDEDEEKKDAQPASTTTAAAVTIHKSYTIELFPLN